MVSHKLYDGEVEIEALLFDGDIRGRYVGEAVQGMAEDHGFKEVASIGSEFYDEATDDATNYLNDHVATDGKYFYWEEGSFWYGEAEQEAW